MTRSRLCVLHPSTCRSHISAFSFLVDLLVVLALQYATERVYPGCHVKSRYFQPAQCSYCQVYGVSGYDVNCLPWYNARRGCQLLRTEML
jgi:hypothetical protein